MQTFANNVFIWLAELSTLGTTPYKIVIVAMPIAKRRSDVLPRCQLCVKWICNDSFRRDYICSHVILHISYISMFVCVLKIAMTMSQNHLAKTIGSMLNMINVACPCVSVSYPNQIPCFCSDDPSCCSWFSCPFWLMKMCNPNCLLLKLRVRK